MLSAAVKVYLMVAARMLFQVIFTGEIERLRFVCIPVAESQHTALWICLAVAIVR